MRLMASELGRSVGDLSNMSRANDTSPPFKPRDGGDKLEIDEWADFLQLEGEQREKFKDLAAILHLPPPVRDRFSQKLSEAEANAQKYETLLGEYRDLRAELEKIKKALF